MMTCSFVRRPPMMFLLSIWLVFTLAMPETCHVTVDSFAQGTGGGGGQGNKTAGTNGTNNTINNTNNDIDILKDYTVLYTRPLQPTQEDRIMAVVEIKPGSNISRLNLSMSIGYEVWAKESPYGVSGSANVTYMGNGTGGTRLYEADLGIHLPDTHIDFWFNGNMTRLAEASVTVAPLQTILWHYSLSEARSLSKELSRPMMLLFYSHGSSVSERMDRELFTDEAVIGNTSGVVCMRVDAGDNLGLVDRYEVETYPTIIFMDPNGTEVSRRAGSSDAGTVIEELQRLKGEGPGPKDEKVTVIQPFLEELLLIGLSFLLFMVILLVTLRSKRWGT